MRSDGDRRNEPESSQHLRKNYLDGETVEDVERAGLGECSVGAGGLCGAEGEGVGMGGGRAQDGTVF